MCVPAVQVLSIKNLDYYFCECTPEFNLGVGLLR